MYSDEMKRFDSDMNNKEELITRFEEICEKLSKEMKGCGASETELMAKAANELGYQITVEDLERNIADRETLDPEELAIVSGGADFDGEDEKGHDAWCVTLWHCHTVTLHTEHENNRKVACWSNHRCFCDYYSGCYNDWAPEENPLPDTPK